MWKYKVIDTRSTGVPLSGDHKSPYADRLTAGLNKLGKEGWELCGLLSTLMVFKRLRRGQWKTVPGWPKYRASKEGQIEGPSGKLLRPRVDRDGNDRVALYNDNGRTDMTWGRVILLTFVGEPPEGKPHALHGEHGRHSHRVDNLRWGSHTDNMQDRERDGTTNRGKAVNRGTRNANSKLNESKVRQIKGLLGSTTQAEIARQFGVSPATITEIKQGKRWAHVE